MQFCNYWFIVFLHKGLKKKSFDEVLTVEYIVIVILHVLLYLNSAGFLPN